MKYISKGTINIKPALVQTMAWCWIGNKPLSEPMMAYLTDAFISLWPEWLNEEKYSLQFPQMIFYL